MDSLRFFLTRPEQYRHVSDPLDQSGTSVAYEHLDERIAFAAVTSVHFDFDQLMGFQGVVEFFEQTFVNALLAHPYRGTESVRTFF